MNCNKNIFTLLLPLLLIVIGCGDSPPDIPSAPENIGNISFGVSVKLSPVNVVTPDSIYVVVGNNPGMWIDNPDTILNVSVDLHEFELSFPVNDLVVGRHSFNAEVVYDQVIDFPLEFEAGSVVVTGRISPDDPNIPDSIAVVLDGDSLGYHPNPLTIPGVLTGSHSVITYSEIDGSEFIGTNEDVVVAFNTTTDIDITLSTGGVLIVNATSNDVEVDSFRVVLGDNEYVLDEGPRMLSNISEGSYQLQVWFHDDTVETFGWEPDIAVVSSETTRVDIEIGPVSPFVGYYAPNIECTDFNGTNHSYLDHLGEVTYFYFFSGT